MYEQVVVLVGTERHLHAEDMAVETVKAARPAGLASVAALLLSSGGRQVSTDEVTVVVATGFVTIDVDTLGVECCQQAGVLSTFLLWN
jgi:hypothetical protein